MGDLPSRTLRGSAATVPGWLKQRSRWIKGYVQTLITHLRAPLTLLREAGWLPTCAFLVARARPVVIRSLVYPVFAVAASSPSRRLAPGAIGQPSASLTSTLA